MFLYFLKRLRAKRKKVLLVSLRAPASINYDHASNKQIYAVTIRPVQSKSVLYNSENIKLQDVHYDLPKII